MSRCQTIDLAGTSRDANTEAIRADEVGAGGERANRRSTAGWSRGESIQCGVKHQRIIMDGRQGFHNGYVLAEVSQAADNRRQGSKPAVGLI